MIDTSMMFMLYWCFIIIFVSDLIWFADFPIQNVGLNRINLWNPFPHHIKIAWFGFVSVLWWEKRNTTNDLSCIHEELSQISYCFGWRTLQGDKQQTLSYLTIVSFALQNLIKLYDSDARKDWHSLASCLAIPYSYVIRLHHLSSAVLVVAQ